MAGLGLGGLNWIMNMLLLIWILLFHVTLMNSNVQNLDGNTSGKR